MLSIFHIRFVVVRVIIHDDNINTVFFITDSTGNPKQIEMTKEKKRHEIFGVIISGEDVSSRSYNIGDPVVKRILKSEELYTNLHGSDNTCSRIDFIRKDKVDKILRNIITARSFMLETFVSKDSDIRIISEFSRKIEHRLKIQSLRKEPALSAFLADRLFKKTRLPMLVFFLFILIINVFIQKSVADRVGLLKNDYADGIAQSQIKAAEIDHKKELIDKYNSTSSLDFPFIADNIASFVPPEIRLNELHINHNTGKSAESPAVIIKGEALKADSIPQFVEDIQNHGLKNSDIVSIRRARTGAMLNFEIHLDL